LEDSSFKMTLTPFSLFRLVPQVFIPFYMSSIKQKTLISGLPGLFNNRIKSRKNLATYACLLCNSCKSQLLNQHRLAIQLFLVPDQLKVWQNNEDL
jgi:hypothetical protein